MNAANGWNGTTIRDGQIVRVWDRAIRGVRGVVEGLVSECNGSSCVVTITKASRSTGWQTGNRITLGVWWLEPVA